MLHFLIKRPIGVFLTFAMFVLLGVFLFPRIPISLLPEVDVPYLRIHLNYPGHSAESIEAAVTRPIRLQMLQVSGIEDVWSTTENGRAELELRFHYGQDMSLAYIEANEKLDQIASRLPQDLERPLVNYNSLNDLPVLFVAVTPEDVERTDFAEFGLFCKNVIKRRLEQLDAVSFVDITGYDESEIRIIPDYTALQQVNLDESDLAAAIRQNNVNLGSILLKDGQYQFDVQFKTRLTTLDDIRRIGIPAAGRLIPLEDVAEVRKAAHEARGRYMHGEERGVLLSVLKQPDANIFTMKAEIDQSVRELRTDYPTIHLNTTLDQSQVLRISIDNLRSDLIWGALFAVLILFTFYRRLSAIFLIAVVIPSTIISSLLLFYLFDLSINIISISGLILGTGLMMDNSIIIIENITQFRQRGLSMTEAAVRGAGEVFVPLLTSMLTTCAVFIPLLFMSGVVGELFYEQAISITICLTMSLVIAYIIIPVLTELLGIDLSLKNELHFLERYHHRLLDFSFRWKGLVVLGYGAILVAGILMIGPMKKEAFPPISRDGLEFFIDWNQNITLEENVIRAEELIREVSSRSTEVHLLAGEQQFLLDRSGQSIQESRLICIQSDPAVQQELIDEVRQFCAARYPDTRIRHQYLENSFDVIFRTDPNDLYIQLRPSSPVDPPGVEEVAESFGRIRAAGYSIDEVSRTENLVLHIDEDKAVQYQVPVSAIRQRLEALLNTYRLGVLSGTQGDNLEINIHQPGPEEKRLVRARAEDGDLSQSIGSVARAGGFKQQLRSTMIRNTANTLVPLHEFVAVDYSTGFRELRATRMGESFIIPVREFDKSQYEDLRATLSTLDDFTYTLSGPFFQNQERMKELFWVLLVSLLLLFMVISVEFESIRMAFVILLTIPFGIAGSIVTLYLAGQSLSILSMIGIVVMAGIMVNDAILKLDMIVRMREEMGEREAIYQAGIRRVKPIVMTTFTTVLALVPILFSAGLGAELQIPLAFAVIGGVIVGTFASVMLIPLIYLMLRKK